MAHQSTGIFSWLARAAAAAAIIGVLTVAARAQVGGGTAGGGASGFWWRFRWLWCAARWGCIRLRRAFHGLWSPGGLWCAIRGLRSPGGLWCAIRRVTEPRGVMVRHPQVTEPPVTPAVRRAGQVDMLYRALATGKRLRTYPPAISEHNLLPTFEQRRVREIPRYCSNAPFNGYLGPNQPGSSYGFGSPGSMPGASMGYGAPGQMMGYGGQGSMTGYGAPGQMMGNGAPGQMMGNGVPGQWMMGNGQMPMGYAGPAPGTSCFIKPV